jgi:peptidoglycan/xylan/chitin deacetylase (PgdA/CDA1 family)
VRIVRRREALGAKLVALTFDDGPSQWTAGVLDALAEHGARGTFFLVGSAVEQHPELVTRMLAEGHELGNHTYSHPHLSAVSEETIASELERAGAAIEAVSGSRPRLFRPPHFDADVRVYRVAAAQGIDAVVGASVISRDWAERTPEPIVERVLREVGPGDIVNLHDGAPTSGIPKAAETRKATVEAVARIAAVLRAEDYDLVTVSELLSAP